MDVIETERLVLRPFTQDDAPALFELFSLPEVARWSGTGQPMTDVSEAIARIERMPERAGGHPAAGLFATVRRGTGAFVGMTLLVRIPSSAGNDREDHEIGWHLHPDAWGHGYATEAATALVQRGFDAGMPRLVAVTNPDNIRSQAVCHRLGMTDLGLTSDWYDRELRAFSLDHRRCD
ncbi:GNAT family N-acetyltransferase [Aeromicrobium wangtongii]|uniref:GNAT family N-acetyltransferase n=1 Tax=Aeromicrobium wangtongii TaxID=2969247 RepID=A0ABY5MF99_9ACTN|nr:GNAT family N-acetyltransferase [Aeromicrobium wangtongii]MCD9197015.1 GNAT family N-acetyltransferase [Aeromicrobium wangtongii]UUP14516.1 GNAT family N-acetyltransferase [Aeromicrobium wangtongii]